MSYSDGRPTPKLHDGDEALIASNDNWKEMQQAEIEGQDPADESPGIDPGDDADAGKLHRDCAR